MVALSSLDVRHLSVELRRLEDGHVDKVYQVSPTRFYVRLRLREQGAVHVVVEPGQFVAVANEAPETPSAPSNLAMALRKQLGGARLRRVEQHNFDRVLKFVFDQRGEPRTLVVELFGKGNLIVAGAEDIIILVLRGETFRHRTVRPGKPLVFPPARASPFDLGRADFDALCAASEKDAVRLLAMEFGLGGDVAEEVVHGSGVPKHKPATDFSEDDRQRLWTTLRAVLERPSEPGVAQGARGHWVVSHPLTAPVFADVQIQRYPSLSAAILAVDAEDAPDENEEAPDEERQRLERQIEHQERGLAALEQEAERTEALGHLVYAQYATVDAILERAAIILAAGNWQALAAAVGAADTEDALARVERVDAKRGRVVARVDSNPVELDPSMGVDQNATRLYDEAKRIRSKAENAKAALAQARKALEDRSHKPRPKATTKARSVGKRFWYERYRWFFTSRGHLVVAGRDAGTNERLVKRHLKHDDRYVHADVHGAPSVVVKAREQPPDEESLLQACQFGASFSRAFNQFAAASAYWVTPEQVSKTPQSGEYLPKGSFIIRGQRNYQHKLPIEVAVALVDLDAQGSPVIGEGAHRRVMSGPPAAVGAWASSYVLIRRGDQKATDVAKALAKEWGLTADEVVAALPPANLTIAERVEASA